MSSFPKFKFRNDPSATFATPATFEPKSSESSESSKYASFILRPDAWSPILRDWVLEHYEKYPDSDRVWVKEHHPNLYGQIVRQENRIDSLGPIRFADLMEEVREWRRLMLQAEFRIMENARRPLDHWPKPEERCSRCGFHNYDPATGQCDHCEREEEPCRKAM